MRYTDRMANFKVHVSKDYLIFCAAHFVTYDGECEPLHGHNYRASVTVEGTLQEDQFVINFVTLKRIMRGLVDQLDHLTLLPEFNPHFRLTRGASEVIIEVENRRYVLPASDVKVLPIPNTTAEKLAEYLAGQLREQIGHLPNLTACEMEVSEVEGQSALYREEWK
jgi:6-pyruvoyltetrahydropterin/6-carboxytetrahydropterin synthase